MQATRSHHKEDRDGGKMGEGGLGGDEGQGDKR